MTWRRNPLLFTTLSAASRRIHLSHTRFHSDWLRYFFAAGIFSLFVVLPASSQQSGLQSSFLPAIIRTPVITGFVPDIAETEHLPYLTEVTKENQGASVFHPTPSDVLIQQAEDKFRSGSRFYAASDFDHARLDFDAAIALMLRASDTPTNRSLF